MKKNLARPPAVLHFEIHFRISEEMRGDVEWLMAATRSHTIAELFRFLVRQEMKVARLHGGK